MPHLELLKLSKINCEKLWDDKLLSHSRMQNLKSLTIDKCGSMRYAFSSSVARELVNLKSLKISNCKMLEDIFVSNSNDEVGINFIVSNSATINYCFICF